MKIRPNLPLSAAVGVLCLVMLGIFPVLTPGAAAQTTDPAGQEGDAKVALPSTGTAAAAAEATQEALEGETKSAIQEYEWIADDDGTEYRIEAMPKLGAQVEWLSENRIRYRYRHFTVEFDVLSEDEESYYVKVYRPEGPTRSFPAHVEPAPEELAAIAAKYVNTIETVDRLHFQAFDKGLPKSGQWRNIFDIADMNGDGHPDILHGPPRKGTSAPVIFLGDGQGGWKLWEGVRFPTSILMDYGAARAADFNGDGHMDIALAMHLRGLAVMVGDGKGSFTLWSEGIDYETPGKGDGGGFSSRSLQVVDWNQDGKPDILALGEGPRPGGRGSRNVGVSFGEAFGPLLFLNRGDGTWERRTQGNDRGSVFGDHLDIGDFNADGQLDFVTASGTINRRDVVNMGSEDGGWTRMVVDEVRPRGYVRAVTVGDFNADGLDDIALAFLNIEIEVWRTGIDILYARKEGGWTARQLYAEEGRRTVTALDTGDFNGDGAPDLVALTGYGDTWIFLGDGKGFFAREESAEISVPPGGCQGYHVAAEDLDGDGKDEIISGFAGEPSALFAPDRCSRRGELAAWKVSSRPEVAESGGSSP